MSRSPGYAVATQPGEELAVAAFRSSRSAGPTEAGSDELLGGSLLRVPDLSAAVALARTGDEDAFRAVYRAVQPGLLRYLHGLVGPEAN
ncbi:MAG TPA: hypothetical protein VF163_02615, partial [Micromonosporaceae bacterium]